MQKMHVCVCARVCMCPHSRSVDYMWGTGICGECLVCDSYKLCYELGCRRLCVWWAWWMWGYCLRGLGDKERMWRQRLCSDWWGGGEMAHM